MLSRRTADLPGTAGIGDAVVATTLDSTLLRLSSHNGAIIGELPRRTVARFVRRTLRQVRQGREGADVDSWVVRLPS